MAKSSPFEVIHERLGATFAEYDGWRLVKDYGDEASEQRALMEASAAFDLSSFGRITVTGGDSWKLIDSLLAGKSEEPKENSWIWSVAAEPGGAGGYVLRVGRMGQSYMLLTRAGDREAVYGLVSSQAVGGRFDEVKVTDITEQTGMLGIYGPGAFESVRKILPLDISGLEAGDVMKISFFMISITILRGSWVGLDGVELICPASVGPMAAGAVAKYHKRANITPAGMECLEKALSLGETETPAGD